MKQRVNSRQMWNSHLNSWNIMLPNSSLISVIIWSLAGVEAARWFCAHTHSCGHWVTLLQLHADNWACCSMTQRRVAACWCNIEKWLISFASVAKGKKSFVPLSTAAASVCRTSRADPWGKCCSARWSRAVTHNTVSEVQRPNQVHMGNVRFYKGAVNGFKGIGLNFTRLCWSSAPAQGRPTSWRSSMRSAMSWLPVRSCPLGGLWSESPVSSLSSSPANQHCPLLGRTNRRKSYCSPVDRLIEISWRSNCLITYVHLMLIRKWSWLTNWLTDVLYGRVLFHRHHFLLLIWN